VSAVLSPLMVQAIASLDSAQRQMRALSTGTDDLAHLNHFDPVIIDLAQLATKQQIDVQGQGYGIYGLVQGSHPGARVRLKMNSNGGGIPNFAVGRRARGAFGSFTVEPETGCPAVGKLNLLVMRSPVSDFDEGMEQGLSQPVQLLGSQATGGALNFVTVAKDTDPSGATPVGSFQIDGCSKLSVLVDGLSAAANATTFDLVPWSSRQDSGNTWCEQGTQRVSVPDSDTSGTRYRLVTFGCQGKGLMYFAVRNLQGVARTGLGFYVEGYQ
jgi:hypothetical protein